MNNITISVVSHGQGSILRNLIFKLNKYSTFISKVVITLNIPERLDINSFNFPFELVYIENASPKGFAENHNQAFAKCKSDFFCVMNPDIDLDNDPFDNLIKCFKDSAVCVVAPQIRNTDGVIEDSARYFPTIISLARKFFFGYKGFFPAKQNSVIAYPDWVGGMFLLFDALKYRQLKGFDERYFLYYEDVDLCLRIWREGFKVLLSLEASVIHDARRASHKNLKYMKWHMASMIRFFVLHTGRYPNKVI